MPALLTLRRPLVVLLGVLLTVPATATAFAEPADGNQVVQTAPGQSSGEDQQQPYRLTLLTGDVVTYSERAGGQSAVSIDAAPRHGPPPVFRTSTDPDGFYVIPSDAEPYLASGAVDRELFDVKELAKEGLADTSADKLPVIVSYGDNAPADVVTRRADDLPASDRTVTLPSIDAAAVDVHRAEASAFWQAVAGPKPGKGVQALGGGVRKLRLDRKIRVSLDQSAPQIGAPEAWRAGLDGSGVTVAVLDTGIDPRHPDLAGRIADSRNFTEDPDTNDGFGHGTHVASIIAGSGAASGGRYRGIADGVRLLNGKVLDSTGSGEESGLMAGMEWAAHAGARVINLSLGAGPSDGHDPVSELVDKLTAETGALFVVAAGNSGEIASVEAPAAAGAALAVGAVDKSDRLAAFSSRGPRLTDAVVKPEIVAPGVNIAAARAAGTNIGQPVGEAYTRLSGTSMATPHVAGAAAILAQKHPAWRSSELKAILTSTGKDDGATWYEQGAGRVDIPSALASQVLAPSSVSFGRLSYPDGQAPVARPVTYTNITDHDLTLSLKVSTTLWSGGPAPDGVARLNSDTVVVPAKGQAAVTLTIDPKVAPPGAYGGLITATVPGGPSLRTPLSFYDEPQMVPLTVKLTDSRGGAPAPESLTVIRDDYDWTNPRNNDPFLPATFPVVVANGTGTVMVPRGKYSVTTAVVEDAPGVQRASLLTAAGVAVNRPGTISLDARAAVPMQVETEESTDTRERFTAVQRTLPGASVAFASGVLTTGPGWHRYITPVAPAAHGTVGSQDYLTLSRQGGATTSASVGKQPESMYNLYFHDRNGVPAQHVTKVDPASLVAIPTRYHGDRPDLVFKKKWFALPTDSPSAIALSGTQFQGPAQWTEYVGPVDDKVLWKRYVSQMAPDKSGAPDASTTFSLISEDIFGRAGARPEERWFQAPIHGGAATHTDGDFPRLCSLCRGDTGEFLPAAQWMDSTPGHFVESWQSGDYPSKVRMRQGNREIPGVVGPELPVPLFPLGKATGTYRLEVDDTLPDKPVFGWPNKAIQRLTPRITTVATFNSAPPVRDVPPGYGCLDGWTKCAYQPIITVDYQLGLDLLNQAPADRVHTFDVTVGHHEGAESAGRISEFRLWYSTNDGAGWAPAEVVPAGDGHYTVRISHPRLAETTGFVSLRAEAWDTAGNRVNQTLQRAYALTATPTR